MTVNWDPSWEIVGYVPGSKGNHYPIRRNDIEQLACECTGYKWRKKCRHLDAFNRGEYAVEMMFNITFKQGPEVVAVVEGRRVLNSDDLTIEEAAHLTLRTEAFLEKLTGLRVHIEQVK